MCFVCGQSRSPLASQTERDNFAQDHLERCGRPVQSSGFFADTFADALSLVGCENRREAYSVAEALRAGGTRVLDMDREDLQVLVIVQAGTDTVDVLLYDPMPGGSGLLKQMCDRFAEVVGAAVDIVANCPSACDVACIDCLLTFRNAFFHRHLDRKLALSKLTEWGQVLTFSHDLPPKQPAAAAEGSGLPVNEAESLLKGMLQRAGFPEPVWHHQIQLGMPLGSTSPDCFFRGEDDEDPGTCVYLDGLSQHIHGNPATRQKDLEIRAQLRADGYEVIEIAASDLSDREAMRKHFYRLGRFLLGKAQATTLREDSAWFDDSNAGGE